MRRPLALSLMTAFLATAGGAPSARAQVPVCDHVLVVVMENKSYDQARVQAYTASLVAAASSFASSHGVTHPSLPNYLALWGAETFGVDNDNCPSPGSPYMTENLGQACEAAGLTWKAYSEDLPFSGSSACVAGPAAEYTRKHAPWTYWNDLNHANEVPFTQFALDTAAAALPRLAFVVPNNCHNTHDCPLTTGDDWLAQNVPGFIDAVGPYGLVILTWDEDDYASDNHILTVFAGPLVRPGYLSARAIDHYTVVRTICETLRLAPFGNAVLDSAITDVWGGPLEDASPAASAAIALGRVAPNPARGIVRATLTLPEPVAVDAAVHDLAGRRVATLASGMRAGTVALAWDGRDARGAESRGGVYFLRVRAGDQVLTRRIVRLL